MWQTYRFYKAAHITRIIVLTATPLWVLLFFSNLMLFVFYGISIFPASIFFIALWLFSAALGTIIMIYTAIVYSATFVDCWSGTKPLVFAACVSAHLSPFLPIFPFFLVWCLVVMYERGDAIREALG